MKRFIVEEVKLDADHPLWPNEIIYKMYDSKYRTYLYGCYVTPEAAIHYMDLLNNKE